MARELLQSGRELTLISIRYVACWELMYVLPGKRVNLPLRKPDGNVIREKSDKKLAIQAAEIILNDECPGWRE